MVSLWIASENAHLRPLEAHLSEGRVAPSIFFSIELEQPSISAEELTADRHGGVECISNAENARADADIGCEDFSFAFCWRISVPTQ